MSQVVSLTASGNLRFPDVPIGKRAQLVRHKTLLLSPSSRGEDMLTPTPIGHLADGHRFKSFTDHPSPYGVMIIGSKKINSNNEKINEIIDLKINID